MDNPSDSDVVTNSPINLNMSFSNNKTTSSQRQLKPETGKSCRKGRPIPGFGREVILKVAEMCKLEGVRNSPFCPLTAPTKRAALYSGVSERTIQRIKNENKKSQTPPDVAVGGKKDKVDAQRLRYTASRKKKKNYQGQVIASSAREIISRVINACYKEFEGGEYLAPLVCTVRRTAFYTGVSPKTIQRIKRENKTRNETNQERILSTPGRKRQRSTYSARIGDHEFHRIRKLIYELLLQNVVLTSGYIFKAIKELDINFNFGEQTLARLLHSKGFLWQPLPKGRKILVERRIFFQTRLDYIKKIKKHENEGYLVVYLDETLIGSEAASTYRSKSGIFSGVFCSERLIAFTEFSPASITRESFKFIHPNTDNSEAKIVKSASEKWLKDNLFPNIPVRSLIIMNPVSRNFNQKMDVPNQYSTKTVIIDFLKRNKLTYNERQTCAELLDSIRNYVAPQRPLELDEIIENNGHLPLRLPEFMSEFNPIAVAYDVIKQTVRKDISSPKTSFAAVKNSTLLALDNLQLETIERLVSHIIQMEGYFLENEQDILELYDKVSDKSSIGDQLVSRNVEVVEEELRSVQSHASVEGAVIDGESAISATKAMNNCVVESDLCYLNL